MKTGVLGAGTWGLALARMLSNSEHDVTVWSAVESEIDELNAARTHKNLPDVIIPDAILFTKAVREACEGMDIVLFVVPSVYMRSTAAAAAPYIKGGQLIVCASKGIEGETLFSMTKVIEDELLKHSANAAPRLVALSGPTHAEEVSRDLPSAIVAASADAAAAELVQRAFTNEFMRVYTHFDIEGVELCGAVKNVIALAAGIAGGLGYEDNTKAALITRGLAEIGRLGVKMGCDDRTFFGLAGVGDLIVTATSAHSRNNQCGRLIGQGLSPAEAVKQVGMVVEGINALPAAMALKQKYGVYMPITEAVNSVIFGGADPQAMVVALMGRRQRPESEL